MPGTSTRISIRSRNKSLNHLKGGAMPGTLPIRTGWAGVVYGPVLRYLGVLGPPPG